MTNTKFKVANAPCSWGVIENIEGDRAGYARVLDEMQETGYRGTELGDWGFMPTDPDALRPELTQRNLQLLGSWTNVHLHDESQRAADKAEALRIARLLADVGGSDAFIVLGNDPYTDPMRTLNAGRIGPEHEMSDKQWRVLVDGAHQLAQTVRQETGLRTVFHHHIGTWVETPDETAKFLERTDPELVGLVFDTGHYSFGGGVPMDGLKRHKDRIWYVHFKDHDPVVAERSRQEGWDGVKSVGQGVFCELGEGNVDFPAVLEKLTEIGYEGWIVVEQDVLPGKGSPKESARRNRTYLESIGL